MHPTGVPTCLIPRPTSTTGSGSVKQYTSRRIQATKKTGHGTAGKGLTGLTDLVLIGVRRLPMGSILCSVQITCSVFWIQLPGDRLRSSLLSAPSRPSSTARKSRIVGVRRSRTLQYLLLSSHNPPSLNCGDSPIH